MEKVFYSKSRIDTFKKCKHQYELKYVNKIDLPQPHSDDLEFGHWIHKVLEFYNPDLDNKKEVVKFASEFTIKDNDYRQAMPSTLKNAIAFTKLYWKYERKTEEEIEYSDDELAIKGVVDLRMVQKNGLIVVDYKSSKSPNAERHAYQIKMYILMLSRIYSLPVEKIRAMIYYPRIDMYDRYSFSTGEIKAFERQLKEDISEIEMCKSYPVCPGYHCKWCSYLGTEYCHEGKKV